MNDLPSLERLNAADAAYRPFRSFADWAVCGIDATRWARLKNTLQATRELAPNWARALELVKRTAAIETGAIEGLYDVDAGFTLTMATGTYLLSAAEATPELLQRQRMIEAQLEAYDYVMDFATGSSRFTEAWLRQLHSVICARQGTYKVQTSAGPQEHELPLGEYKKSPNHVLLSNDRVHSYAPVDQVGPEMHRLCDEFNSESFQSAHPVAQSAFAHHAFVSVHPFADGNGRVARALASTFTLRSDSLPLLILNEQKGAYLHALRAADSGDLQAFVDFILSCAVDTAMLVSDSAKTAAVAGISEVAETIRRLYFSEAGLSHSDLDEFAARLRSETATQLRETLQAIASDPAKNGITWSVQDLSGFDRLALPGGYRKVVQGSQGLGITVQLAAPAEASANEHLVIALPSSGRPDDDVYVLNGGGKICFSVSLGALSPTLATSARWRLKFFAERFVSELLQRTTEQALTSLRKKGFLPK